MSKRWFGVPAGWSAPEEERAVSTRSERTAAPTPPTPATFWAPATPAIEDAPPDIPAAAPVVAPKGPAPRSDPRQQLSHALHRPSLRSSVMTAALAVGVVLGFVIVRGSSDTPNRATLPTTPTTTPVTTPQPTTTITVPPTTTATTIPAPTTTVAGVGYCTPADLSIATVTDASSYTSASSINVTLALRDIVPCVLNPVGAGQRYNCAATIVIASASNNDQVYPWSGQLEDCAVGQRITLTAGETRTVSLAWNQQVQQGNGGAQAPRGRYFAEGDWAWSSGSSNPYVSSTAAYFNLT